MTYSVEQFAADIRAALQADEGGPGREAVRKLVAHVLTDNEFIAAHAPLDADKERNVLYEDPDLGFSARRWASRMTTGRPGRSMARPTARPR
jgi:hypothetical protein